MAVEEKQKRLEALFGNMTVFRMPQTPIQQLKELFNMDPYYNMDEFEIREQNYLIMDLISGVK